MGLLRGVGKFWQTFGPGYTGRVYTGMEIVSIESPGQSTGQFDGSLIDAAGNKFPIHGNYDYNNPAGEVSFNDAASNGLVLGTNYFSGWIAKRGPFWMIGNWTEQGYSGPREGISDQHGLWWAGEWSDI